MTTPAPQQPEREPFAGVDEFPRERNGRPIHDQNPTELGGTHPCWRDAESVQMHYEHDDAVCPDCGCCWGCDEDCCAQYETSCPNDDCGCSRENQLANQKYDNEQRAKEATR